MFIIAIYSILILREDNLKQLFNQLVKKHLNILSLPYLFFKLINFIQGASSLYIPSEGLEVLFLMVMWERLPFNIRYREIIRDDILTPEEKEIKKKIGSFGYNSMDITQFVWDRVKNMSATEREKFKSFEEWKKLTPEERQPYLDLDQKKRQHSREMMIKAIKERDLPPLAELSVEDICGDVGSFAWKYIQRVIKVKEEGYDENQLEKMSKKKREKAKVITGTYVVIGEYRIFFCNS